MRSLSVCRWPACSASQVCSDGTALRALCVTCTVAWAAAGAQALQTRAHWVRRCCCGTCFKTSASRFVGSATQAEPPATCNRAKCHVQTVNLRQPDWSWPVFSPLGPEPGNLLLVEGLYNKILWFEQVLRSHQRLYALATPDSTVPDQTEETSTYLVHSSGSTNEWCQDHAK